VGHQKFDVTKLEKLNDPGRFDTLRPSVMWDALGRPRPRVIVDIGAGTGLFAATFAGLAEDAVVYAADTESTMVEWMRANRPEVAAGKIVPVESDETRVPLDDGIADLVVMINLHHELAEPAATYAESWRLLAPGGQLLVVDWAPVETPRGPSLAIRISPDDAVAFLEAAGFVDVSMHDTLPWHWLVVGSKPA
jgi:SAM-dependent methyltransferase